MTTKEERAALLEDDRLHVKFGLPAGLMFVGGVSSHYELELAGDIDVAQLVPEDELIYVIQQFNDSLQSYWPCTAVYACGCVMAPFTLGASLFAPNYCISHAEEAGTRCLEQISLKAMYYDRNIKFTLKKTWGCSSYLEVSFPVSLLVQSESGGVDSEVELKQRKNAIQSGGGGAVTVAPGAKKRD
jgi:hypothetical protein